MEGQATWLSWAYLFWTRTGRGEIPENRLDELAKSAGAEGPVYSSAPLYIRESLVFPYQSGHSVRGRRISQAGPRRLRPRCSIIRR